MKPLLCLVQPWNTKTDARVDIRVADALTPEAYGLGGFQWLPAMETRPQITVECMSLDLNGQVQAGRMTIGIAGAFALLGYKWRGAPISIWSAPDLEYVNRAIEFIGEVTSDRVDLETGVLRLTCEVSTSLIDKDMLTLEFDGSGGANGDADMRGTLKPAGFGFVQGIEPVWFDKTNWVGMIDGYGNTVSVDRILEGASEWGAAVGDYPSYAALVAAIAAETIAPGQWGTCIAEGLIGLGAPPAYPIGVDAQFGFDRLGTMMQRILTTHAAVSPAVIDAASFTALDVAVPYDVHLWVKEQRNVKAVIEALSASANATPIITPQGKIVVSRATVSAPIATLDRSGQVTPRVTSWESAAAVSPWWQIKARVARPANVLTFDQVLFADDLIDRGTYNPATTYRVGNIVWLSDGSSWLYINDTPTAGNYPPDSPLYWEPLSGAKGVQTLRNPDVPATDVPIGSVYWDDMNHPYRLEYGPLYFDLDDLDFYAETLEWVGWVSVQDQELRDAIQGLQSVDDDGVLTIDEKIRIVIPESTTLEAAYLEATTAATASGLSIAAATSARAVWLALRDGLVPAWNDTTQPTNITRADWDTVLSDYRAALEALRSAVATAASLVIIPPEAQQVLLDSGGSPKVGQFPRTLTPGVARGSVDIRDDDYVSYGIATSGVTATINNTNGDPDKGRITVTAGGTGYIDLTITVNGQARGPYRIAFTATQDIAATATFASNSYSFEWTLPDGTIILEQGGSTTVNGNSSKVITFSTAYSVAPVVMVTGNPNDTSREGNCGLVGNPSTTQFTMNNSSDLVTTVNWMAKGKK